MKIDRLLSIVIILLNRDLVRARELSDRFGVSIRTIQRDMESLQDAGIPVMTIQGPNGGYGIMENWRLDRQVISMDNLFYILTSLQSIADALPDARLDDTLEKVKTILPQDQEKEFARRQERLHVDFSLLGGKTRERSVISLLEKAIEENRLIKFQYTDNRLQSTERTVEPMTLVFKWRSWYLFAFCKLRMDFRLFRISRIRDPEILAKAFIRRKADLDSYLQDINTKAGIKTVSLLLKFDSRIASVAEDVFAEDVYERFDDGTLIVKTEMPEDGWLYGFLLSFGSFLEVLEPDRLRKVLKEEGDKISDLYSKSVPTS
ncbi:MAG: helix-turn-helix transcriptional regulator [Spirochaetia bacterium]